MILAGWPPRTICTSPVCAFATPAGKPPTARIAATAKIRPDPIILIPFQLTGEVWPILKFGASSPARAKRLEGIVIGGISPATRIRQMTLSAWRRGRYNEAYAVMD